MKRFVSILLFTLIIVGIVGCGKKEQTVPDTQMQWYRRLSTKAYVIEPQEKRFLLK